MPTYPLTTFVNDTGAKTEIINADKVNDNFSHCLAAMPPIGSIVAFYDYGGLLTFNADYWQYCNGAMATIEGIGPQTTPDLSNRYLVGFGTEAGGDVGSAAWATAAVGAASHLIDLAHTHTGPSHVHSGPSHTHTSAAHTHGAGTLQFKTGRVATSAGVSHYYGFESNGPDCEIAYGQSFATAAVAQNAYNVCDWLAKTIYTKDGAGSTESATPGDTGASGTGDTGAAGTGATGSGGSATTSIAPRSVRVRWIIRKK